MVELIDDRGNLFGRVNVVDALAVLLVLAVAVAGIGLVLGGDQSGGTQAATNETVVYVDYRSEPVEPYVADAIPEGAIGTANVTSIENKTVTPARTVTQNESGALSVQPHPVHRAVTLRVGLNTVRSGDEYLFNGTPLEVGTSLTLDLGPTTVSGRVTAVEPGGT